MGGREEKEKKRVGYEKEMEWDKWMSEWMNECMNEQMKGCGSSLLVVNKNLWLYSLGSEESFSFHGVWSIRYDPAKHTHTHRCAHKNRFGGNRNRKRKEWEKRN